MADDSGGARPPPLEERLRAGLYGSQEAFARKTAPIFETAWRMVRR